MNPLDLFPSGVDQSILPAVLVGLFVLLFLTESFGWVFAGLVVPGYLASVFVFSPAAGIAVLLEAVVTFVVARAISTWFSRTGAGVEFFGRDRFFLILVVAVLVRQVLELALLPALARALDGTFGTALALDGSLAGIGMVLVPITANCFWKLDVPRGLWQVGLPTLITYAIVAFVLLPYTNLSFAHHEVTYEDAALDFLASPKVHLILLSGAYLASRYNLDYGWDYNGILVPGLMALTWFEPHRAVSTLVESLLLFALARGVVKLPVVRGWNLEGPRRIAFVFTLGVAFRGLVALAIGAESPDLRSTDVFGFGYLLSSLLAAKMLQARAVGRVILPTIQVSLAGFVAGSVLGLGLEAVLPARPTAEPVVAEPASSVLVEDSTVHIAHAAAARVLFEAPPGGTTNLQSLVAPLAEVVRDARADAVDALLEANPAGIAVRRVGADLLVVREAAASPSELEGRDTAIVRLGARGPLVEVRHPEREPETVGHAAALCLRIDCSVLAVAGIDRPRAPPPPWILELQGAVRRTRIVVRRASAGAPDEVWVRGRMDASLPLPALLPGARVALRADDDETGHEAVVLRGTPETLVSHADPVSVERGVRATEWLFHDADVGLDDRATPSHGELRFFADFVVRPLLVGGIEGEDETGRHLRLAAHHAAQIGHGVLYLPDGAGPGSPLVVLRSTLPQTRGWGTIVVRTGEAAPIALTAPQPAFELGTDRLAFTLFDGANARALMIGGDRIRATAVIDEWQTGGIGTTHFAFHTSAHRVLSAAGTAAPLLAHVRGLGSFRTLPDALLVGLGAPRLDDAPVGPVLTTMLDGPLAEFLPRRFARGEADTIGLDGWHEPSIRFSHDLGGATPALLWFSEAARRPYLHREPDSSILLTAGLGFIRWEGGGSRFFALERRADRILDPRDPARRAQVEAAALALEQAATGETPHPLRRLLTRPGARVYLGFDEVAGSDFLALELDLGDATLRALSFSPEPTTDVLRLDTADGDALEHAFLLHDRQVVMVTRRERGE